MNAFQQNPMAELEIDENVLTCLKIQTKANFIGQTNRLTIGQTFNIENLGSK